MGGSLLSYSLSRRVVIHHSLSLSLLKKKKKKKRQANEVEQCGSFMGTLPRCLPPSLSF